VCDRLAALGQTCEIQVITTTGDRILDRRLESVGGKGAFLKEIEEALAAGEVDLAVHSLKDVPVMLPPGLRLAGFLERADPRDAWLSPAGSVQDLPGGARVGTTSLRRQAVLHSVRPDLQLVDLRGNVDTRIRRLREGDFDAIVLALAGLVRLGRATEVREALDPGVFTPAPGQGAIAIEYREGDDSVFQAVAPLCHEATARAVSAERAVLALIGGGCNTPLGAYARDAGGGDLRLCAFAAPADGGALVRVERTGREPVALGEQVAVELLARGASGLAEHHLVKSKEPKL
jgi:hydroxymethylbilane synthase